MFCIFQLRSLLSLSFLMLWSAYRQQAAAFAEMLGWTHTTYLAPNLSLTKYCKYFAGGDSSQIPPSEYDVKKWTHGFAWDAIQSHRCLFTVTLWNFINGMLLTFSDFCHLIINHATCHWDVAFARLLERPRLFAVCVSLLDACNSVRSSQVYCCSLTGSQRFLLRSASPRSLLSSCIQLAVTRGEPPKRRYALTHHLS